MAEHMAQRIAERILIVDDDLDTLHLVGFMLEGQGYQILAASTGAEAVSMSAAELPDLILLDWMMPDMDGVEVARQVRAKEATHNVPIIMFTARSQVEDKLLGYEAGVDDYITKPAQPRELFAHVKALLARSSRAAVAAQPASNGRGFVIGILAARGGLGVSTLALNLGVSLQVKTQKDVIVAEYRPGQGTISLEVGYLHPEGLNRLLQLDPEAIDPGCVEAELTSHSSGVRFLLASSQPKDARLANAAEAFEAITSSLPDLARFAIIDLGSSLTPVCSNTLQKCDRVVVVLEPVPQTLIQTKALLDDLSASGVENGRMTLALVNRSRSVQPLTTSQVQEQLGRDVDVIFTPAPELAFQASMRNIPIVVHQPDSLTAQQFDQLAEKIVASFA